MMNATGSSANKWRWFMTTWTINEKILFKLNRTASVFIPAAAFETFKILILLVYMMVVRIHSLAQVLSGIATHCFTNKREFIRCISR